MKNTDSVLQEVKGERVKQEEKWGEQNHNLVEWCAILGEEVGEVQKAALEWHFKHPNASLEEYRKELIQVAAVAVSMVESLDRNI